MPVRLEYRVEARNLSQASENRIHDDDVARRFGFGGGLVPGVEVYAYMTHLPVAQWGIDWLERGTAECKLVKPVYDGKLVTLAAAESARTLAITAESDGVLCATGAAALSDGPPNVPSLRAPAPVPVLDARPAADEGTLAVGRRLSSHVLRVTRDELRQYLRDIHETESIYARESVVHPAYMLRVCNFVLKDNVTLGPWIHTASSIRHCGLARVDEPLAGHGEVAANYERNGHRFVDLDVTIAAGESRPVAQVRHTAIYRLRDSR